MKKNLSSKSFHFICLLIASSFLSLNALNPSSVKGQVKDKNTNEFIFNCVISLYNAKDSVFVSGTTSDVNGVFCITSIKTGVYFLKLSHLSYQTIETANFIVEKELTDLGLFHLNDKTIELNELVFKAERIKLKKEAGKTIYFMNKQIQSVSNTGTDVLKYIPGIQINLFQEVSYMGKKNILLLINGKKYDMDFLKQLNASDIDRIEFIDTPDPKYGSNIQAVLNILLKKKEKSLQTHASIDLPVKENESYLFPSYSLHLNFKKTSFYTSWNGEISKFNLLNTEKRIFRIDQDNHRYSNISNLLQNTTSNKFHLGINKEINPRNNIDFYSFIHPSSNEFTGKSVIEHNINGLLSEHVQADTKEKDKSLIYFFSVFFNHKFNSDSYLNTDLSYSNLTTTSEVIFNSEGDFFSSKYELEQNSISVKTDFNSTFGKVLKLNAGARADIKYSENKQVNETNYYELRSSAYLQGRYSLNKHLFELGGSFERKLIKSSVVLPNEFAFLPQATYFFNLNERHRIKLSYKKTSVDPTVYQLIKSQQQLDPNTITIGNSAIRQETVQSFFIEHFFTFKKYNMSTRFFIESHSNRITDFTFINKDIFFENKTENIGNMISHGIQVNTTLQLSKRLNLNPYLRISQIKLEPFDKMQLYGMTSRSGLEVKCGLSGIVSLKKGLALSFTSSYSSPEIRIQGSYSEDLMYYVSIEKTLFSSVKVSLSSAMPLKKDFKYQSTYIETNEFIKQSEGNINKSLLPIWIKVHYQFNRGSIKNKMIERTIKIDKQEKKGF